MARKLLPVEDEARVLSHMDSMEASIGRMSRYLRTRMGEEGGLSPSQYLLLCILSSGDSQTVSELASHLGMTAAGATGLIDRLVKADLAERIRDEADRRVVWVRLSPAGKQRMEETRALRRKLMAEILGVLSPGEVETLVALHRKVASAIPTPVGH